MLIVFSGLPGVGKTAIARELARTLGAVHRRQPPVGPNGDSGLRQSLVAHAERVALRGRTCWRAMVDVEIVCSDAVEHRRRVETRQPDITGHILPSWREVVERDYHAWDRDRLVVDTAGCEVGSAVEAIVSRLRKPG